MKLKNQLVYLILLAIVILGLCFRFKGIMDNHSFWADEALVSSYARDIVSGKSSIITGMTRVIYEPLQIILTALFFKLFGISEFSARLPAVIFGTIGILFAYLIAAKLSNKWGGLLAAFLFAFSQLNLANSTQAKPYTIIQTLFLVIIYLIVQLDSTHPKKSTEYIYVLIIFFTSTSALFHISAILFFIPYVMLIPSENNLKKMIPITILVAIIGSVFLIIQHDLIMSFINARWYDNSVLLKNLLFRQYGMFVLFALLSFFCLKTKKRSLAAGLFTYSTVLLFIWNFKQYSHNIRYLVPLFDIIFVMFGVFWGKIGEKYTQNFKFNGTFIPCLIIAIVVIATHYKIILKPMDFYSPNADFYGDVQVADYKDMYRLIREKISDYQHVAVFNDTIDAQRWYMPEKKIDAYFMKGTTKPYKHPVEGGMIYGTLADFIEEKAKYQKGVLIVEDWESFLPEDIKQYAKQNMKLEIKVDGLKDAPNDPWPLEVYSWGI